MTVLELKNQAVLTLLRRQPFMFHLIAPLRYEETDEVPTAAVLFDGVSNESWLKVNPNYVAGLSILELEGLLAHEIMHVLHDHVVAPHVGDWVWNIAADLAVNTILLKQNYALPKGALTPESVAKQLSEELQKPIAAPPSLESAYWYYRWLHEQKKSADEKQSSCGGSGNSGEPDEDNNQSQSNGKDNSLQNQADSHAHWTGEQQDQDSELTKRFVAQHVQKALEQSKGSLPGYLEELTRSLLKVLEEPKISWSKLLKRFVGFRAGVLLKPSSGRENKYGQVPRIVFRPSSKFVVFVDVSGSVDDRLASRFFSELEGLSRQGHEFDIGQFAIDVVITGKFRKNPEYLRYMRGGTDFKAPFRFLSNHNLSKNYDGVIILTDGEADWPQPEDLVLPSLWVLSQELQPPPHINSIVIED